MDNLRVPADGIMPRQLADSITRTKHQKEATAILAMISCGLFDLESFVGRPLSSKGFVALLQRQDNDEQVG